MSTAKPASQPTVLFIVQNFTQGWGGAPESVRLMARRLSDLGVKSDVYDRGGLIADAGQYLTLPNTPTNTDPFDLPPSNYAAILQMGPWQSPKRLANLYRGRGQARWIYLPRGGLADVEFARTRDLKKYPYLALVERNFISRSDAIVFSSNIEQVRTISWAYPKQKAAVIPDFLATPPLRAHSRERSASSITFAFLAEISPRKGLHLLLTAFSSWAQSRGLQTRVRLVVGGAPRPGSESYFKAICAQQQYLTEKGISIDIVGPVAHNSRESFYNNADVLVVSSSFESFGLTVFEAAGEGCVVLTTSHIGALEHSIGLPGIISTSGTTVDSMINGLDAALEALRRTSRSERAESSRNRIGQINADAARKWQCILNLPLGR